MKKRIALFANGWVTENLYTYMDGIKNSIPEDFVDIYAFLSYESYGQPAVQRKSHSTIYTLPDLTTFDAAIVFYPGLNFADSINYIYEKIQKAGIPVINIGTQREGCINLCAENYSGMLDLCNHLIEQHNVKSTLYIAGSADNADSNERFKALNDALKLHNCPDSDIFYSNWENISTKEYTTEYLADSSHRPDAIICANDILATFCVLAAEANGLRVPEDIIVTGFDYQLQSQIFYPSISTVSQNYNKLGELTSKAIEDLFSDTAPYTISLPCAFHPAESCGCSGLSNSVQLRNQHAHEIPYRDQKEFQFSSKMFNVENTILYSDDYYSLKNNLHDLLVRYGSEDNSLFVMSDPVFADIGKEDAVYKPYSFNDNLDVVISRYYTKDLMVKECNRKQVVPGADQLPGNHIYLITNIFLLDFVCGYLVLADDMNYLRDYEFYNISNRINRVLISLKHNLQLSELNNKLSELMDKDTLTNVKNRAAYEKYLNKLERDFIEGENSNFAVIYFDINNLKTVNDMYGHEKGDAYIKNSCRLICNTFKHSPVFRIGGDEFVCIVTNADYNDRHELLNTMKEHMETLKSKGDSVPLTERISIASGMAEYDRTLDADFSSIFKRADEIMYENKYKMKKNI